VGPSGTQVVPGGSEYFDETRADPVSAHTGGSGGLVVRPNPGSKFWDFDALYPRNPLTKLYLVYTQIYLRETDLSMVKVWKRSECVYARYQITPCKIGVSARVDQYHSITVEAKMRRLKAILTNLFNNLSTFL